MTNNAGDSLKDQKGGPADWLGHARYETDFKATEWEVKTADWRGPLRGVKAICLNRLKKATLLMAECTGPGQYAISDIEGDVEWVNLTDPQVDRCHCPDFLFRGEDLGTPCKHMLAALIADGHPGVTELVADMKRRDGLAAALSMPVTD